MINATELDTIDFTLNTVSMNLWIMFAWLSTQQVITMTAFIAGFSWINNGIKNMIDRPFGCTIDGTFGGFIAISCAMLVCHMLPDNLEWMLSVLLMLSSIQHLFPSEQLFKYKNDRAMRTDIPLGLASLVSWNNHTALEQHSKLKVPKTAPVVSKIDVGATSVQAVNNNDMITASGIDKTLTRTRSGMKRFMDKMREDPSTPVLE